VLQWVPAGALVLIFFMQFLFSWVGIFPGGVPEVTQGPWGAATGFYFQDKDLKEKEGPIITVEAAKELNDDGRPDSQKVTANEPGFSPLLFFYLVPFFFLALAASVAVPLLPLLQLKLPPAVEQILPWKWAIVLGLNGVLLLFLLLQMLLGFSLESSFATYVNSQPLLKAKADDNTVQAKKKEAARGLLFSTLQRTYALYFTLFLHVVATGAALLVHWIDRRGPGAPPPILEMKW
jgi:hypothetical protein